MPPDVTTSLIIQSRKHIVYKHQRGPGIERSSQSLFSWVSDKIASDSRFRAYYAVSLSATEVVSFALNGELVSYRKLAEVMVQCARLDHRIVPWSIQITASDPNDVGSNSAFDEPWSLCTIRDTTRANSRGTCCRKFAEEPKKKHTLTGADLPGENCQSATPTCEADVV